jgi:hydroxymethylpyrimidine pyrophosphatase-like HAD family hydrolase
MARQNINGWARINYEYQNTPVYLVMKHRDSTRVDELNAIGDEIEYRMDIGGFYVHRNDNNIALLPDCIEKGLATEFLLHKLRTERGNFPVIGMGDSLSDYRFLKLCSWFGMPKQGQFAEKVATAIFNRER